MPAGRNPAAALPGARHWACRQWPWIALVGVSGFLAAWVLAKPAGPALVPPVDDVAQFAGPLLLVPFSVAWPRRRGVAPSSLRHWAPLLLILAALCFGLGQLIWSLYELVWHDPPFPSWADAGFLGAYPCLLGGILLLPARPLPPVARTRVALDGVMVMVSIVTVSWYFLVGPTLLQASNSVLGTIVGTAYPLCDLVLLSCLCMLAARRQDPAVRHVVALLAAALAIIVCTDSLFDYGQLHGAYATGGLLDVGWPAGYMLVALAARRLSRALAASDGAAALDDGVPPETAWQPPGLGRALLPYAGVPVIAALAVYVWQAHGDARIAAGVTAGAGLLIFFVLLRQIVAMRETVVYAQHTHALATNNAALTAANQQLEILATTDRLTNLSNRALLQQRLDQALSHAAGETPTAGLLLLDLDRFKEVNDTLGHHVGDALLVEVAERLRGHMRGTDTVGRLGGDEFAIVLPGAGTAGALTVARNVRAAIEAPFVVEGQSLSVGVSIGIAIAPEHGASATLLLQRADVAMYEAKHGQLGCAVYDAAQDGHDGTRLTLVADLSAALTGGDLQLYYQPKMTLASGRISGVEALVRWLHPVHGLLSPDRFIPLAEQTGLIVPLTRWVIDTALRQVALWAAEGLDVPVAVNVSLRNLRDPGLVDMVAGLLRRHGVPPAKLCLELTESVVMADVERTRATLDRLATLGCRLAIDDFGTGYSSLAYLSRLPVGELKIDRSFVRRVTDYHTDRLIVASTISLGHALGMEIVTEGVEDAAVWDLLSDLGSDAAQGYYLTRPLPAPEMANWMRRVAAGDPSAGRFTPARG